MAIKNFKDAAGIAVIVALLILPLASLGTQAQPSVKSFEPTTMFRVPAYNGTINFAENGTCSNATFQNNMWTFTNLQINGSNPLENFTISAKNCNVTILFYEIFDATSQFSFFGYTVEGKGVQILNLGFGPENGGLATIAEWGVFFNNKVFASEGQGWTISHDGTMSINGANENVTIIHQGEFSNYGQNSNLPFYEQHSVAIAIIGVVAATVAVGVVANVSIRRRSGDVV